MKKTKHSDPALYELTKRELLRQRNTIEMIASESIAPEEVLELSGSIFTNKTLEGYPGSRFQAGSKVVDELELLGVERAKALFGADHANLQVYSGSMANYAVYASILNPGDTVLSMRLDHGGHLTHGSPANFLSKVYKYDFYGVQKETETIDYNELEAKANNIKPKLIIAGGSSYPRLIDYERISNIAKRNSSIFLVDMAHLSGLVSTKLIPSPVPFADFVSSSTTKTFCGPRSAFVLCKAEYSKALDKGVFPGSMGSIHLNTLAATVWSLNYAASEEFKEIMKKVLQNAKALAKALAGNGFRIVSGGTDNHIVMVDLRDKGISGKQLQLTLDDIGISLNKNQIPFDTASPFVTSGVRIGLTSVSQRGFGENEIFEIADIITKVVHEPTNLDVIENAKKKVKSITDRFPIYEGMDCQH